MPTAYYCLLPTAYYCLLLSTGGYFTFFFTFFTGGKNFVSQRFVKNLQRFVINLRLSAKFPSAVEDFLYFFCTKTKETRARKVLSSSKNFSAQKIFQLKKFSASRLPKNFCARAKTGYGFFFFFSQAHFSLRFENFFKNSFGYENFLTKRKFSFFPKTYICTYIYIYSYQVIFVKLR